ncbi:hypothetical protein [Klebsiella oxytoca]|uniref:hypothetical protein n=1 Tax=Klebsiella oxytoca TaxID=571 RepID=UPI0029480D25|nr:hypothetical protein [Klebsiella oxytoca]WOL75561.1 hypothetical protein KEGJGPDJ_00027 [Klebsiella oxytoca]WOL75715.1 hypothetical protein DGBHFLOJ_00036 [Klebsiella oxytoca]HED3236013.1 hypothetical protein [Klebsiella oxytoca]HED3476185.1 hypothetical protein [Klebsiella oxytoca]
MDEQELFRELKDSGHKFVWYLSEPGISNPDGNSPDVQFIVDLNGKELARRLNIPDTPENGWRIDSWHARDFGGLPEGAVKMNLNLIVTRFHIGLRGSMLPEPLLHIGRAK